MPITIRTIVFWSAVSCVFGLMLLWGIDLGIHEPAKISAGLSPRAYPSAVLLLMLCASLYLVLESVLHHKREQTRIEKLDERDVGVPYSRRNLLPVCVIVAGYCLSISFLGLALASVLAFVLLTHLGGERRTGLMLCIGAALAAGLYYFFLYAAAVPMPTGPFGGVI
ncbi:MAG: tripartite tricarboxylate transporter TctB family protein [Desulfovibrionaceae bacterium]|nr:tripartite tricarboxylate transporter TctB family protein [Desulfovibrionaceae bacterium]